MIAISLVIDYLGRTFSYIQVNEWEVRVPSSGISSLYARSIHLWWRAIFGSGKAFHDLPRTASLWNFAWDIEENWDEWENALVVPKGHALWTLYEKTAFLKAYLFASFSLLADDIKPIQAYAS